MIALGSSQYLTPEEYLELEKTSEIRHEYIDGEIYAMAGGTEAHNLISLNVAIALRSGLKNSLCRTFMSDMKVHLQGKEKEKHKRKYFYPDVMVCCDGKTELTRSSNDNPTLIVEVLSKSTEAFDRGDKFSFYRSIASLQEYILVSSHKYSVDYFRRGESNLWVLESYQGLDKKLYLKSLGFEVSLAEIYENIVFESQNELAE